MNHFKSILVAVDTTAERHPALERAALLATHLQADLKIIDVLPEFAWPLRLAVPEHEQIRELLLAEKRAKLEELAAQMRERGVNASFRALVGRSSLGIIREVLRDKHDLVVKETKGRRSRRVGFLGTTSTRLLRKCPSAVWLVNPKHAAPFERVLAAVDATPDDDEHRQLNHQILDLATWFCRSEGCHLEVAHVWSLYGESILKERMRREEFEALVESSRADNERSFDQLLAEHGLSIHGANVLLVHGDPSIEIPGLIKERQADLIIMGSVARTGIAGLLIGNTAERILERVECSVLAIKPPGFVSPVTLES